MTIPEKGDKELYRRPDGERFQMEPMSLWPEISSTDILAVEKLTRNEIDKGKITVVIPREGIGNNFPSKFPPFP